MKRFLISLAFVPVAVACAAESPEYAPLHSVSEVAALDGALAETLPQLLSKYHLPGASVAVLVEGDVALLRGYGRLSAAEGAPPVDEHTVFQAASLSKPVFAYGVHRWLEDHPDALDLDRALIEYRPPDEPFADDPRLHRVTARHVLSHTTGLPNWRRGFFSGDRSPLRIEREPGTRFGYSGEGYVWLQRVVEQIRGEPLDVFLQKTVLDPLGMEESSYVWQERFEAVHAVPHDGKGRPQEKRRPREPLASGTLNTTAADYARFLQAMLEERPAWLARESRIDEHLGWALGWGHEAAEDGDLFWQWGDDGPFKALVAGCPERGVGVVVFTNGQRGLNVARPVVERVLGSGVRFVDFRMLGY